MKVRKIVYAALMGISIASCRTEDNVYSQTEGNIIVLQERHPSSKLILSKKNKNRLALRIPNETLEIQYYLGRGYKNTLLPIGDPENIAFPVIDVEKLYRDRPSYFSDIYLGKSNLNAFSYAGFQNYSTKSSASDKSSGGFSFDLGLFSIGAKKTMSKLFTSIYNDFYYFPYDISICC